MTGLERGSRYEFRVFVSNIAGRKREPASKEFNVISGDDDEGPGSGNGCSYYFVPLLLLPALGMEDSRGGWTLRDRGHTGFPASRVPSLGVPLVLGFLHLFPMSPFLSSLFCPLYNLLLFRS